MNQEKLFCVSRHSGHSEREIRNIKKLIGKSYIFVFIIIKLSNEIKKPTLQKTSEPFLKKKGGGT